MADSKYAGLITDELLDSLKSTESSGNPYAVNKDTKAMGAYQHLPETVQMLHKQGIQYNPFDEKQQRQATRQYLTQLLDKNNGDLNAAVAQYGGFKTKDPSGYIKKVTGSSEPTVQGDEFDQLLFGKTPSAPKASPSAQPATQGDEFDTLISEAKPVAKTAEKGGQPAYKQVFNKLEAQSKNEPLAIQKGIASTLDTLLGIVPAAISTGEYAMARASGRSPEKSQKFAEKTAAPFENPIGKTLGITESPAYKKEAFKTTVVPIATDVIKNLITLGNSPEQIAEKTGMPLNDVNNIINSVMMAVPEVAGKAGRISAERLVSTKSLADQFATKKGEVKPTIGAETPVAEMPITTVRYNEQVGFQPAEYAEKSLPVEEQQARAEVLHRIDPNLKVDPNVIEGRGKDRATDYQLSKTDTPEGNLLSEKLKEEKASLTKYGEKLIEDTGDKVGLDESASHSRGRNTLQYFKDLENHFDESISKIYKERDEIAKGIPVTGENIKSALSNEVTLELGDNAKLAKAASAKLKQLNMMDKDGNMLPSDGYKAEQFRKWLNEKGVWDRGNAKLHSDLKRAVDEDVISTIDPNTPLYKEARDLHGLKKDTLENPKGIASILESSGPNGINRQVDIEKIPSSIEKMSVDQFTHLINTINNAPPALKAAAEKSLSSIKSQFLNRAHEAFQKNANAGTKYLRENNEVMKRLFTPAEMAKINDYNAASHILKTDTGYPGAKVQEINLEKRLPTKLTEQFIKKGGAVAAEALTGGHTLGIAGATAHEVIAGRQARREARQLEKIHKENLEKKKAGFTNLSDIGKKENK